MLAVYKKELRGYLTSMIGYVFVAFVLLILGIYFTAYNLQFASPDFGMTLNSVTFIFLIITPILTMKILAEEKKNKTDQLLWTAPVPVWKVVMGKYLSMVTMYLIPVAIDGLNPLIMGKYGTVSYAIYSPSGLLLPGLRADCSGNVFVFRDRESGHCGGSDLWRVVLQFYDGRN